jgi:DNA replication initiation complex subunit (GINS family)
MYDELYFAWRLDQDHSELGSLPPDFYKRIADYLRKIKDDLGMLPEKNLKSNLLDQELINAKFMVQDLIWARYRKILKRLFDSKKLHLERLSIEEVILCNSIMPSTDAFSKFATTLLEGQSLNIGSIKSAVQVSIEFPSIHKRVIVRFLKQIPCIIGNDMKSYGPFLVEDIATVPLENSKVLIKQGLAQEVTCF